MKLILAASLIMVLFYSASCVKGGKCEQAPSIYVSSIQASFKDKGTGKYLYAEVNPTYDIDSIKIYDQTNQSLILLKRQELIPNTAGSVYWSVNFGNIYNSQTDANAFNVEVCRNFIVKYTYNDSDTIKACFKIKNTKCNPIFQYLNVYYRGDLVGSVTDDTGIIVTINKP